MKKKLKFQFKIYVKSETDKLIVVFYAYLL